MNNRILFGSLAILLVVVIAGALLFVNNANRQQSSSVNPTPQASETTISPTSSPSASPTNGQAIENETTVVLGNSGFTPATVTIKVGEKVVWKNESGEPATVSSDPHPVHTNYPPLNLGNFKDGENLELIFTEAGTYGYHNHFNSSQKGTVIVK